MKGFSGRVLDQFLPEGFVAHFHVFILPIEPLVRESVDTVHHVKFVVRAELLFAFFRDLDVNLK